MNSIWNNNLKAFNNRFPQLTKIFSQEINFVETNIDNPPKIYPFWKVFSAKNGSPTASENNLSLHSSYNPQREAAGTINNKNSLDNSNIIFYGFGLGYHVIEAANKILTEGLDKKIILIEPQPLYFFASLTILDWTQVFKVEKLIIGLACPPENVLQLIESNSKINLGKTGVSDAFYLDIASFTKHDSLYFASVKEIIKRNIEKNNINQATLKKFGKLWIRNSLRNLDKMQDCQTISSFKNKGNLPFLIIGAGPSLENILPHLEELKKRMIIVCVETALKMLLRRGIQPDFIILLDPQYWAYKHIAGLKSPESIIITEICAYPSVFRFNCKEIRLCSSQFPLGQYFEKKLHYCPGDLGTGGSVAASAWNFASYCGAKEIYLAGLDLGFPGKETHIRGSSAEENFHKISNRLQSAEKFGISSLFSANAQKAKNYLGQPIITDSRMKMFAWWFESRIAACPEIKTYTLCPQGLFIPGVEIKDLEVVIKNKPEITKEKETFINQKNNINLDKKAFQELKKNFPDNCDFWQENEFLREYF
ncbi:MAG: DUF115 domain-containing protein [Treponema sp.]|nr:DUF115 domain-containing protein [Treponema sp.]